MKKAAVLVSVVFLAVAAAAAAWALVPRHHDPRSDSFQWAGLDPMESGKARYAIVTMTDEGCRNLFGHSLQELLDQKRDLFEPQLPAVLADLQRKHGVWIESLAEMPFTPLNSATMRRNGRSRPDDEGWVYRITELTAEARTGWIGWQGQGHSTYHPQAGCRYVFATQRGTAGASPDNLGTSGLAISGAMTPPNAVPFANGREREQRGGYLTLTHSAGTATVAMAAIYRDSEVLPLWNDAANKRLDFESSDPLQTKLGSSPASMKAER